MRNERLLIARELHDVVAHGVSVMVVHAGAARRVIDERPEQARDALQTIETTGREALVELRRLVGILRADGAAPPLDPQRGLDSLGALIASVGSAGVPVELAVEGEPRPLPAGVDLAAYRIVQEALTNTIKHAGHARARVRVAYEGAALDLEIVDDGRSREPDGGRRAIVPPGQGHGLIGMRERVHLYGGDFEAGPRQGGGFRVRARLPLEGAQG